MKIIARRTTGDYGPDLVVSGEPGTFSMKLNRGCANTSRSTPGMALEGEIHN